MANSESAVVGGKPIDAEHMARIQRELSGLAPEGAADISAVTPVDVLPYLSVARQAVGSHVTDLKLTLQGIERELERPPLSAGGQPNQYIMDRYNDLRETAERIKAEIESIGSWSDHQVRVWAHEHGYR
jgi:hypothetical protein